MFWICFVVWLFGVCCGWCCFAFEIVFRVLVWYFVGLLCLCVSVGLLFWFDSLGVWVFIWLSADCVFCLFGFCFVVWFDCVLVVWCFLFDMSWVFGLLVLSLVGYRVFEFWLYLVYFVFVLVWAAVFSVCFVIWLLGRFAVDLVRYCFRFEFCWLLCDCIWLCGLGFGLFWIWGVVLAGLGFGFEVFFVVWDTCLLVVVWLAFGFGLLFCWIWFDLVFRDVVDFVVCWFCLLFYGMVDWLLWLLFVVLFYLLLIVLFMLCNSCNWFLCLCCLLLIV